MCERVSVRVSECASMVSVKVCVMCVLHVCASVCMNIRVSVMYQQKDVGVYG